MRVHRLVAICALLATSACSSLGTAELALQGSQGCVTEARSVTSAPGRAWLQEQGWRFQSPDEAASAYTNLVQGASPWPDWLPPQDTVLPPGTRFQMAIGGAQTPDRPGSFGTFDNIDDVEDVRSGLAVRTDWKPEVDRVVTYEVIEALPVRVGPVGPQVDGQSCRLLMGRWSQLQLLMPAERRMMYLKVISIRTIG